MSSDEDKSTASEEGAFDDSSSGEESVPTSSETDEPINSDNEAPSPKRKKTLKASKKTRGEVSERVLEARREFDEALGRIRPQGGRRRGQFDSDPVEKNGECGHKGPRERGREQTGFGKTQNALRGSRNAQQVTLHAHANSPNRKHMHEILLDCGILSAVKMWLEPLPNKSLPAVNLRKTLLELLRNLPIETDHLRDSQVGRIVMFFARRPHESPDIQRLAKDLISRWSRPLIGDPGPEAPREAPSMQSAAFREASGREGGLSAQHRKLAMRMQKKARSKGNF